MYSNQLKNIVNYFKNKNKIGLRKHSFYNQIKLETNFLLEKATIAQRFWHVLNDTKKIPKCKECKNKSVKWNNYNKYLIYCSGKCSKNNKDVKEKIKNTCLKKYGVENVMKSKVIKNKAKQTCLEKYGVDNPTKSKIFIKKLKQNWNNKSKEKKEEIKEKIKQTNLKKYGVKYITQSKIIANKVKQSWDNKSEDEKKKIKNKVKQTSLERYGVDNASQKHISKDTLEKLKDPEYLKYQHYNLKKSLELIANELGLANCSSVAVYFKKYSISIVRFSSSEAEKEVFSFIKSIYSNKIITNSRSIITPLELDIYLKELKLAIEFNGTYWHSDKIKPNNYHFNKSKLCNSKDIKLIHIFEDEWNDDKLNIKHWLKKYINKNTDFITKEVYTKDLSNTLELSLNWPINYDKLKDLNYELIERINPEERIVKNFKIYDSGKVKYILKSS